MAKKNIERVKEINSHKWHWTEKSQQAFSELTGSCFHCQYCNAEIEYQYEMENELGEKIYVGSECMKKIGWIQTDKDTKKLKRVKEEMKFLLEIKKAKARKELLDKSDKTYTMTINGNISESVKKELKKYGFIQDKKTKALECCEELTQDEFDTIVNQYKLNTRFSNQINRKCHYYAVIG